MKLNKQELEELNSLRSSSSNLVFSLGNLEVQYDSQRNNILSQVHKVNNELNRVKSEIEAKYGSVTIDTSTGKLTPISPEVKLQKS